MKDKEVRKVPKLRFPGFTDDWEQRKLCEVANVNSGRDYKHLSEGNIPVYGTGGYMLSVNEALSYTEDAIGIGRKGTIDSPYILKAPFWTVDTLFYVINMDNVDLKYLYGIFQRIDWKSKDESTGVPSLSKSIINKIYINIPEMNEQIEIGLYLEKVDNLITLHQRKLENLKNLKKGLHQKMFPKNGEKVPELRFPGFTDDWEQRKLGDVGECQSGVGFPNDEQGGTEGIPFFKVSDMNNIGNEIEMIISNNYVTEEQIIKRRWKPVYKVPAMFFAKIGAAVMLNRKRLVTSPFLLDNNTMAYKFGREWYTQFGKAVFDTIYLPGLVQTGTLPSYNASDVENILFFMPPTKEEQEKIGKYFNNLDNLITLHQRKLEHLQMQKKGLLQQMFV